MKKLSIFMVMFVSLLLLTACNAGKKDMAEFVEVRYSGLDSQGTATYSVDEEKLLKEVLEIEYPMADNWTDVNKVDTKIDTI